MLNGHVVNYGKHRTRRSFSRIKEVLKLPNLTDVQTESYKWFLDKGIKEVFDDIIKPRAVFLLYIKLSKAHPFTPYL